MGLIGCMIANLVDRTLDFVSLLLLCVQSRPPLSRNKLQILGDPYI